MGGQAVPREPLQPCTGRVGLDRPSWGCHHPQHLRKEKEKGKKKGGGERGKMPCAVFHCQRLGGRQAGRGLVGRQTRLQGPLALGRILGLTSPTLSLLGRMEPVAPVWDGGGDGSFRGDSHQLQGSSLAHRSALPEYWGPLGPGTLAPSDMLCQVSCEPLPLKLGELKTSFFFFFF